MEKHREPDPRAARRAGAARADASAPLRFPESRRHRLKQLRAFCQVARLGSISRAAERVFCTQPAVSMQIRSLEDELDVSLVQRRGPSISLTPAGRQLYRLASPLVEGIERLPDTFAEQYRHVAVDIHIAAGPTAAAVLLPEYLKRFSQRNPDTCVNVRTGTSRECLQWLRTYEVDLVIGAMDVEPPDLRCYPVLSADYVLITPESHPLAGRELATLHDLSAWPLVAQTSRTQTRLFGEMFLRQHRVPYRIEVEVDGWDAIKACVEAGLGISVVPELCLDERDRVWRIPFSEGVPPRTYGAITRRDRMLPIAVQHIIRIMDPTIPAEL